LGPYARQGAVDPIEVANQPLNAAIEWVGEQMAESYAVARLGIYERYAGAYVKAQSDAGEPIWPRVSIDPAWERRYLAPLSYRC
jgi:hypothetical protein